MTGRLSTNVVSRLVVWEKNQGLQFFGSVRALWSRKLRFGFAHLREVLCSFANPCKPPLQTLIWPYIRHQAHYFPLQSNAHIAFTLTASRIPSKSLIMVSHSNSNARGASSSEGAAPVLTVSDLLFALGQLMLRTGRGKFKYVFLIFHLI